MTLLAVVPLLAGCAVDAGELDEAEETDEAAGAIVAINALDGNGLHPNGLHPNGLHPNGLHPNALSPAALENTSIMDSLRDPGVAGELSRSFVRYAVSCAFQPQHFFEFSWTGTDEVVHNESYEGELGLATEWETGALSDNGKQWVSACMAARVNHYGVSVLISMRNGVSTPALDASEAERDAYWNQEGAFWGNLFQASPAVYSCYHDDPDTISVARSKQRVCAVGYDDNGTTKYCANVQSAGSCAACVVASDSERGYSTCQGMWAITTYLN